MARPFQVSRKTRLRAVIGISFCFFVAEISGTITATFWNRHKTNLCSRILHPLNSPGGRRFPLRESNFDTPAGALLTNIYS
jgi:hypothetical protein